MNEGRTLKPFGLPKKGDSFYDFYSYDIRAFERLLRTKSEAWWNKKGEEKALKLFHEAARRVPAYKDFLRKNRVKHESVQTIKDFSSVPVTHKKNYVNQYPIKSRLWDGRVASSSIIAVSSGTTGKPTAWPRGVYEEREAAIIHELLYRYLFHVDKYETLVIIAFPMGIYVSGVAEAIPTISVIQKGYDMAVVTAGNQKEQALSILKSLKGDYEQIILVGHPFFVKDVLEEARSMRLKLEKKKLKMMFCSEGFNEEWRDYVRGLGGRGVKPEHCISTYGSAEFLLKGYETPYSIGLRKLINKNEKLAIKIFGVSDPPNLFQYCPLLRYIETVGKELVITSASGVPLIKYNLHDVGEIISTEGAQEQIVNKKLKPKWNLPLVTLGNRSDNTMIFYAANIYPENIKRILSEPRLFRKLTGKFAMRKYYVGKMDERLEINIELTQNSKPNNALLKEIKHNISKCLPKINMEYQYVMDFYKRKGRDLKPIIKLWHYRSEPFFKPGLKPKYIARE